MFTKFEVSITSISGVIGINMKEQMWPSYMKGVTINHGRNKTDLKHMAGVLVTY